MVGFGGPPTHIVLLRELCVERREWIAASEFEDAIAVCNLLPGPASTQLAIYCASRVAGWPGAIVGGAGFILPGLAVILGLAALFLSGSAPEWVRALGAGGGAAVAAVAVRAGVDLMRPSGAAEARGAVGRLRLRGRCRCRSRRPVARRRPARMRHRRAGRAPWARPRRRAGAARCRPARRRLGGARLDGLQGRRPELRRRLRDHPAHAGGRRLALPLDDVRPVPRGGRARPDHAGARGPDGGGRRLRGVRRRGRPRRSRDRLQPLVHPRAPGAAPVRPHPHRPERAGVPGRRRTGRDRCDPRRRRPARGRADRVVAVRRFGGGCGRAPRSAAERHRRPARAPRRSGSSSMWAGATIPG